MRRGPWGLAARAFAVIAVLALVGIVLRLIGSMLTPLIPLSMWQAITTGWGHLYNLISPAIGPIGALAILALAIWTLFSGRR